MSITVLDKEAMVDGVNYLSSLNVNLSKFLNSYNVPTLPVEKNYFWPPLVPDKVTVLI